MKKTTRREKEGQAITETERRKKVREKIPVEKDVSIVRKIIASLIVLIVLFGAGFIHAIHVRKSFIEEGTHIGTAAGKAAGTAVGSWEGYIDGQADGQEAGLHADDTTETIVENIKEVGKLEVLAADVKMTDLFEVGEKYKALLSLKGDILFTVDLSKTSCSFDDNTNALRVVIPEPESKLIAREDQLETLASWPKSNFSFNTESEEGNTAYHDTMAKLQKEYRNTIANYDQLMELARDTALKQVYELAIAANGSDKSVNVVFAS